MSKGWLGYLSHHMFPIDESFKSTHCCRIIQREDILGFNRHRAHVGVFLENDDLGDRETTTKRNNREKRLYGQKTDMYCQRDMNQ